MESSERWPGSEINYHYYIILQFSNCVAHSITSLKEKYKKNIDNIYYYTLFLQGVGFW